MAVFGWSPGFLYINDIKKRSCASEFLYTDKKCGNKAIICVFERFNRRKMTITQIKIVKMKRLSVI